MRHFFQVENVGGIVDLRLKEVKRAEFGAEGVIPTLNAFGNGGEGMIHSEWRRCESLDLS